MLVQINSPLMPLQQTTGPDDAVIPLYQTVGILLSLYALHWQHDSQTVSQWVSRIMPFLNRQQAKVFLTEDKAPYGFASWLEVPKTTHQKLLKNATWLNVQTHLDEVTITNKEPGDLTYLWFVDVLTPFCNALEATKQLKQQMNQHESAWAININQGQQSPRQVW